MLLAMSVNLPIHNLFLQGDGDHDPMAIALSIPGILHHAVSRYWEQHEAKMARGVKLLPTLTRSTTKFAPYREGQSMPLNSNCNIEMS